MKLRTPIALVLAAALWMIFSVAAAPAFANGTQCHSWITSKAIAQTDDMSWAKAPELRRAWINGNIFPDGGYVVDHPYGETAHWEPFITAYIATLRQQKPALAATQYDMARAFVLGLASHGMSDQVFDATFMKRAKVEDAKGWADGLFNSLDTMTDVMLAAQDGPVANEEKFWPSKTVLATYAELELEVSATMIDGAQQTMVDVVMVYGATASQSAKSVKAANTRYPWSSAHLLDPTVAGSLPCEVFFVSRYLAAIDRRIKDPGTPLTLLGSIPRHGARAHPTDHTRVDSQLVLVFSHGVERTKVPATAVTVTTESGTSVDVEVHWWSSHSNLVRLVPTTDWKSAETYTVTVNGLTSIDGAKFKEAVTVQFKAGEPTDTSQAACGPAFVASTAATGDDDLLVAEGGCAASGGAADPLNLALLWFAVAGLWLRGRFAHKPTNQ